MKAILKRGKVKPFWYGHPWIFPSSIEKLEGNPPDGSVIEVVDILNTKIGYGFYNSNSKIRIRLVVWENEIQNTTPEAIIRKRFIDAIEKRKNFGIPSINCNAFRIINSEGDFLSGLIVDRYSDVIVVEINSLWAYTYKKYIEKVLDELLKPKDIIFKISEEIAPEEGISLASISQEKEKNIVMVKENGLNFFVDVSTGQKTGMFLDQRENHFFIRDFVKGKIILDGFCYTGGFGINAAIAGAKRVIGVDTSQSALELAWENAKLNGLENIKFVRQDIIEHLNEGAQYDFIILDPPKFAKQKIHIENALQRYEQINRLAMKALNPNGLLFTCSCSSLIGEELFLRAIREASFKVQKRVQILDIRGQSIDHPFPPSFIEGKYLKSVLCIVS